MSKHNYQVNPDGTINLHCDHLNPRQLAELISSLQGHCDFMAMLQQKPLDILMQSAKRSFGEVSFQLSWKSPIITIDLDNPEIPEPNVSLTEDEYQQYQEIVRSMVDAA